MSPFLMLLVAGLVIAGLVYYLMVGDREPQQEPPVQLCTIADAPDGEPCKLVGVARAADGEPATAAPFGETEVLYHHTRLEVLPHGEQETPRLLAEARRGVDAFLLEDDSGRALVTLTSYERAPAVRFAQRSRQTLVAVPMTQVTAFLASVGKKLEDFAKDLPVDAEELPATVQVVQETIIDGERVVAVGRARQLATLDGRRPSVQLGGDQHNALFLCNDDETIARFARQALATRPSTP